MKKIHKELYTTLNSMTIDEFLLWFKIQTEEAWHNIEEPTLESVRKQNILVLVQLFKTSRVYT